MLDRKFIRKEPETVKKGLKAKGVEFDLEDYLDLDRKMREIIQETELLKHERNTVSLEISRLKKEKKDATEIMVRMKETAGRIREADSELKTISDRLDSLSLAIPNLPHESVPHGTSEKDNPVIKTWGDIPAYPQRPLPHWEIGEKLSILDMPAGVTLTGRGFVVLRGGGARLSRALVNFFLDIHQKQGYEELIIPYMANRDSMTGTGQLPKMEDDMYHCEKDDLFLIPTAEVPITNIYRDSVLERPILPKKCTAYSPCFRREAGSYGQDTRGLIRVHQFDKVEMVKFVRPEDSYEELESLLTDACEILELLEISYRVIELCTADLSFAAAKCYDIETFAPGIEKWLEVSSCSNFEDFQARRARIRTREEKGGKVEFVHTLNGSGMALPRIIATILELNQTPTGKVRIPKALVPYMGGMEYLEA
ncbi:MAG: serine--tRNA ligase [Candidatus Krumholzibacteriota bacterium]|nr:serine--tRNA ligase [Candidatus Krumholzibacteriota bacterium]